MLLVHAIPKEPSMNQGVILDGPRHKGWPQTTPETFVPKHNTMSLRDALITNHPMDAWFQPICIDENATKQHRIRMAALAYVDAYLTAVFLDFDLPDHRSWTSPEEEASTCKDLLAKALALGLPHPAIYSTRGGARLVWPLAEPLHGKYADSFVTQFHGMCRDNALAAGELFLDPSAEGWTRAYRLPKVVREGKALAPAFMSVRKMEPLTWRPERLDVRIPGPLAAPSGDMPEYRELTEAEWQMVPEKYREGLREGRPLLQPGNRNQGAFGRGSILSRISLAMSDYALPDPELLYLAIHNSVVACYDGDEEPSLERVWEKLVEFTEGDRDKASLNEMVRESAALVEAQKAVKAAGKAASEGTSEEATEASKDAERALKNAERLDRLQRKEKAAQVADRAERLREQAAVKGSERAEYPLVVYSGLRSHTYMLYGDDTYHLTAKDVLVTMLHREQGIQLLTDKGAPMGFPAVFDEIGKDCRRVQVDYWLPGRRDFYDPVARELHQTTDPVNANVKAKYHADIDGWLHCLASTDLQRDLLLDWVATVMDLDNPTAALFLCGAKGTGKSLFGDCIASMWGMKGNYSQVVGSQFQEPMLRTPVMVADEGVKLKDASLVEWFKEMVTTRYHAINTKNKDLRYMSGCQRIIITGNSIDAFDMPPGGTTDHVEAVAERLVFIRCGNAGRDYLATHYHGDWAPGAQPGRFVEHMLWLRENHVRRTPAGRLLVQGDLDDAWTKERRLSSKGLEAGVLEALATWASRGSSNMIRDIGISEQYPGLVLVNASALHHNWEELTGDRKPKRYLIPKSLLLLSPWDAPARLRLGGSRPRCHAIRIEDILAVAESSCIGDIDQMRDFLEGRTGWGETSLQAVPGK